MAVSRLFRDWQGKQSGPHPWWDSIPSRTGGSIVNQSAQKYDNLPGGPCAKRRARLARLGLDAHLLEHTAVAQT